jgi:enoyl-CoA hydratase
MKMPLIRIFHNPNCSTSRNVLGIIKAAGIAPDIVEYIKTPLNRSELEKMVKDMNVPAKTLLRLNDPLCSQLNVNSLATDKEIFETLVKYPKILSRPIVSNGKLTKLCRPASAVLELLPTLPKPYVLENGSVLKPDGTTYPRKSVEGTAYSNLIVEQIDTIRIVSINRPDRRNAVDEATAIELLDAFENINHDLSVTAAVLTGTNGTFCAGYDLKSLSENSLVYDPSTPSRTNSFSTPIELHRSGNMGPSRLPMRVPIIAAVEGYAVAGGLELSLWCDIRIASTSAIFGVHCRRWGVPLIDGGTIRLPRLIGQSRSVFPSPLLLMRHSFFFRAMDMILTGRDVDAEEALAFGLANRVVEKGSALKNAIEYAIQISRFPAMCMKKDREMVDKQWNLSVDEALLEEGKADEVMDQVMKRAVEGAKRFAKEGKGRGGDKNNI